MALVAVPEPWNRSADDDACDRMARGQRWGRLVPGEGVEPPHPGGLRVMSSLDG